MFRCATGVCVCVCANTAWTRPNMQRQIRNQESSSEHIQVVRVVQS